MYKEAFLAGAKAAIRNLAPYRDPLLEIGGLGALAVPSVMDAAGHKPSDGLKNTLELGGLGVLAIPSISHIRNQLALKRPLMKMALDSQAKETSHG